MGTATLHELSDRMKVKKDINNSIPAEENQVNETSLFLLAGRLYNQGKLHCKTILPLNDADCHEEQIVDDVRYIVVLSDSCLCS